MNRMRTDLLKLLCLSLMAMMLLQSGLIYAQEDTEEDETSEEGKKKDIPEKSSANALKIIELHNKAIGGKEKIEAINTLKIKVKVKEGTKFYDMTYYYKAPNLYREEKYYKHLGREYLFVKAFDGETGWNQNVSPEKKDASAITDKKQLKHLARIAEMGNPLIRSDKKEHIYVYAGKEVILEKFPTYKIKAYLSDGMEEIYFIDMKNFVLRKVNYQDVFAGKSVATDYYIVKYQKVADVVFPEKLEYVVGQRVFKTEEYVSIDVNKPMEDSFFQMPKVNEYWLKQNSRN